MFSLFFSFFQGATLEAVAVYFDRRRPDKGYAYVAASRVKALQYLPHIGRLRCSDWRLVGHVDDEVVSDGNSSKSDDDVASDFASEAERLWLRVAIRGQRRGYARERRQQRRGKDRGAWRQYAGSLCVSRTRGKHIT